MRADGWELVGWLTRKLTYLLHGKFGKASTHVCAWLGMGYVIVHRRVVVLVWTWKRIRKSLAIAMKVSSR